MVSEPTATESARPAVRLTSTNYALWEFQFRVFVEGRGLLGILEGTIPQPNAESATPQEVTSWIQNDARIRSWLLDTVDPSTCLSLRLFPTANRMWRHLAGLYSTTNAARQFEVETALARLQQGDRSITEYFNAAQELWTEQDMIHMALRPQAMSDDMIAERIQSRVMQFLMRLRPEFENIRATILNRDRITFDGVISSLVREETRLRTQAQFDVRPGEGETFTATTDSSTRSGTGYRSHVLAVTRPQFNSRVPNAELECHHCHEKGHLVKHCRRRNYCVYCKRMGHIVLECRTRERNAERYNGNPLMAGGGRGPQGYNGNPPLAGGGRGPQGRSRPAYVVEQGESSGSGAGSISAAQIDQLVQAVAALQNSLPTAIGTALSTLQGLEDGEADRKGE
ncbi:unnamed protein product [Linum tenue]|uniref:CCHC-type domain-containing protein n=1 Tax=Linum tenue TaxID=586396 RepID=A0AAV0N280_9ROSI|nr:unnamed protein product [Linum tenue]